MRWGLKPFKNLLLMVSQAFLRRKFELKLCGFYGFHKRCHKLAEGRLTKRVWRCCADRRKPGM